MMNFFKILTVFLLLIQINLSGQVPAEHSLLSDGKWFRIAVTAEGIYRIDFSRLKQLGLENPSYPRIYGNNSGQLSYYNDGTATDDLKELPVMISGNDDRLDEGEYLLFHAVGTGKWIYDPDKKEYSYLKHNYSDTAFYFITSGNMPGKRIGQAELPGTPPAYSSSESDALFIWEKDQDNLIKSGRDWFQRISSLSVDPGFTDLIESEGISYRMRVAARSSVISSFVMSEGTTVRKTIDTGPVNLSDFTGTYAEIADSAGLTVLESSSPQYLIRFDNNGEAGAYGWLDFLQLQARRSNMFTGKTAFFTDRKTVKAGDVVEYTINTGTYDPLIWDITDPFTTRNIKYSRSGDELRFSYMNDSLRRFAAFNPEKALTPLIMADMVPNQDLHGTADADMIIVTHPLFLSYAKKISAIHEGANNLNSLIVTPGQIYNEFSGGIPDICAIRNFLRMKYLRQKGTAHPLKYLLLFGDGSYDNKTAPPKNPDYIPTYQSPNSNVYTSSFTSDDFFGLLDEGEGESEGTEDIGIGRLPVNDTLQAGTVISKILRYLDPSSMGDWRNIVCLTADDEDGNVHMIDAESLSSLLQDSVPFINTDKIYLDAYKQVTSANGQSYPDVNKAINDRINAGCLIFNYIGHGNEAGLAHERVVRTEDISSWRNKGKLPLFITATCEFSRFDDMEINIISGDRTEKTSAGEMVLLSRDGGGIALMSTTRLVYSAPNYSLNRNILDCAFEGDANGKALCLGDIIRIAKNRTGNGPNKRNFTLLGDPALQLAYPWHGKVVTDSINNIPVSEVADTMKALSVVTVSGHIEKSAGTPDDSFSGEVSVQVFDKAVSTQTLGNDGDSKMEFSQRKSVLFSGKTSVKNGRFRVTFMIPREINYSFGEGRISYYAANHEEDIPGCFSDFIVGGFSGSAVNDTSGPAINLFLNDTLFRSGGMTDSNPRLLAILEDKGGINTTGAAIGHDLETFLDDDRNGSIILNGYFENDADSYTRGSVAYDLGPLVNGWHSLTLRAWDNYNNSSEARIVFIVEEKGKFVLRNLINFPNPFTEETRITAEHNRPDEILNITIKIFGLDGRLIKIIRSDAVSSGFVLPPVIWDGTADGGKRVGKGIYPYSVTVTTEDGESALGTGKMIIL